MNRMIANVVALTVVALSVFGFSAPVAGQAGAVPPPVKWETPVENFVAREALASYRAVPAKKIQHERATQMIERLREASKAELLFNNVQQRGKRFVFTSGEDASAVFDVDTTNGAFLFNAGLKKYSGEGATESLPSDKEAPAVARKYLADLKDLPQQEEEMVLARVGGMAMAAAKEGAPTETYNKLVTVYFRRVIDGMPVQGRGSRIVVHLGEKAALVGVIRNWSEVESQKLTREQLKSNEAIRQEIDFRLLRTAGRATGIVVRKTELVLFDDGRGVIEPAIHVQAEAAYPGAAEDAKPVALPVDFYVPVLSKPAGYYPFHQDAEARWPGSERGGSRQPREN